jgi:hypothetical protein
MACEQSPNRISRLAAQVGGGIAQLSSKQAFYAGAAVGAISAGVGAIILAKRKAIGRLFNRQASPNQRVQPMITSTGSTSRTVTSSGRSPAVKIKPEPKSAQPIPALAARSQPTKLQAAPMTIQTGHGQPVTIPNSYRVLRSDGADTGLAITPHVTEKGAADNAWSVTHIGSGALLSGPYDSVSRAHDLAGQLAPLRWKEDRVPAADIERAKKIIETYQATANQA